MPDYYAKVCLNGHTLIKRFPINDVEYCEECGSLMICFCQNCDTIIKEWHYDDMLVLFPSLEAPPKYCKSCGEPYPWTKASIEATAIMIQEDIELSELERKNLEESLPDIISETPKTKVASIRVKKALLTAGQFTADALREFVIDFGCELAKKSIGL